MVSEELGQRARIFVEEWAKVRAGERVLVLADDGGRVLYERHLGGEFLPRERY